MKKLHVLWLLALILIPAILYFLPSGGDIRPVRREIGQSIRFTEGDIENAMEIAEQYFKKEFEGCTLLTMTYDEEFSDRFAREWAENYGAEEGIVLYSSFWVDGSKADACFNPDSLYNKWQWILTRNPEEAWALRTWGYG